MRILQALVFLVFLAAVGLFALQNMGTVTVRFASASLTAPVALLVVVAYLGGMVSGGTVAGFVGRSIRRIRARPRD